MDDKNFIGKKRNMKNDDNNDENNSNYVNNNEDTSNSTQNSNQDTLEKNNLIKDIKFYNEPMILNEHSHWVNKILISKSLPKNNLISASADGKIILYDDYPSFKPVLNFVLFGTGVTYLTELKNGSMICSSFGAFKQILINFNNLKNEYTYEQINYITICTTYIMKCIELNNNDLLFISQQDSIIILEKLKNNDIQKNNETNKITDKFHLKSPIKLLRYEISINIVQLKDDLYLSGSLTDIKYNLIVRNSKKVNVNCINFYDENFNVIHKIKNMYLTKSEENIIKLNEKFVIIGVELCLNGVNWNNYYGISVINYLKFEIVSFYQVENQISSISLNENFIYIGDNKGYIKKYEIEDKDIILRKSKRIHFYNINTICYKNVFDKDLNQNIFILFTGSNDNKIKISSFFTN